MNDLYLGTGMLPQFFPILVLGTVSEYKMSKRFQWQWLRHQCGGRACRQLEVFATILEPKPGVYERMVELADHWYNSQQGAFGVSLDSIIEYRQQLRNWFGVDCNWSYRDFAEAVYPIDCTLENLGKLTNQKFPKELDRLVKDRDDFDLFGSGNRWRLYVLGENSD